MRTSEIRVMIADLAAASQITIFVVFNNFSESDWRLMPNEIANEDVIRYGCTFSIITDELRI